MKKKAQGTIDDDDRLIARKVASVFGEEFRVTRHADENEVEVIDILACKKVPTAGLTSYSTVGLSKRPLYKGKRRVDIQLELAGLSYDSTPCFQNILATAAFCIINSKWFCCPGMIFPEIVSMYSPSVEMKHLLFVPPALWDNGLNNVFPAGKRKVTWLLAVPISNAEFEYAKTEGTEALEEALNNAEVDIADLGRKSIP